MRRLTLFAKGNSDVYDTLHSRRVGGEVVWNGINDVMRATVPGTLFRLKHETLTRSDALRQAAGSVPDEVSARDLPLGLYPAASQFSVELYGDKVDAIILSILPDIGTALHRHRDTGFLFLANNADRWSDADRAWLRGDFIHTEPLDIEHSMGNFAAIIERIRTHQDTPILIFNLSPIVPGEIVHCFEGLGETYSARVRRFNIGLADLSAQTGISIIDVDTIIARAGADRLKLDAVHMAPEGYRLIAAEVVRVLIDLGVLKP